MEKLGTKCQQKSMKNKYDAMKKDWRLWKYLKRGETGLGWNSTTGKLECSNEWWENKLKEKPEAKKFRFKGLSPLLEERWDHLFGDAVATGESCVAPSLTPEFVDQSVSQVEEIENREGGIQDKDGTSDAYNGCSQYSKRLEGLDYQGASFWEGFIEDVRGTIAPNSNLPNTIAPKSNPLKTSDQNPTKGVKRKRRESGGSAFLRQHLKKADERHSEIMDLFKQGTNSKKDELEMDDNQRNQLLLLLDLANLEEDVALSTYYYTRIHKEPCMTSTQTGHAWMEEILNGHPIRCVNAFRMSASLFMQLCKELQQKYGLMPSRKISVQEKVGIFLYTLALGLSNRDVSERFQHSGETISRAFHDVLESICGRSKGFMGLARDYIRPKDSTFQCIPSHIENDSRYMPYFKDCIGCIDGTHIDACIPIADQMRYRGRKGVPTFNVMAVCDFDMCFTFVSVGWEGSAHDTRVFIHAIETPSMNFPKPPEGKYYIVDKGYPDRKGYLAPYSRIRYHQSQFEHVLPTNAKEAFNRVHSSLRSCIERSFGVLKKRWKILSRMPRFSETIQIDVIMATFALHNYIRRNDAEDMVFNIVQQHQDYIPTEELDGETSINQGNMQGSNNEMREIRNNIANMIWDANNVF
ncbi:hypothetical protein OSB04_005317 [Centaurea solstitialis]|uniref:DDE Tnp4 domain-containing protein n=1 Tax=Centaurea solstitialis TaxID=347529 RepID=A0AA38TYW6_9ASTR|nr:hypothetical protein OSB04_005317 [Centaurea solstitialis]